MSVRITRLISFWLLSCLSLLGQAKPDADNITQRAERSGLIRAVIDKGNQAKIQVISLDEQTEEPSATLRRALIRAPEQGVDLLILALNNPQMDIIQARLASKELRAYQGPIFAYIENQLNGAAILLALSSDKIYIHPDSQVSSAAVYLKDSDNELSLEQIRELRLISRSEFRTVAQERFHDLDLATSLADPRTPLNKGGIEYSGQAMLFSLKAEEACSRANNKALFAEAQSSTIEEMLKLAGFKDYQLQYSQESFSYTLAHNLLPFLPLLWIGIMMALIFEFHTPGFALGGTLGTAGLCFCLFLQYTLGLANGIDIFLIILGIGLLGVEIAILPGFGVAGISGIISFAVGIVMSFINLDGIPDNPVLRNSYILDSSLFAIKNLSYIIIGSTIFGSILMYLLAKTPLSKNVVLDDLGHAVENSELEVETQLIQGKLAASLVLHSEGLTLTDLHPVGSAKICGVHLDVISHGEHIASQTKIIVTEIEGNRVVVEEYNES